MTFINTDFWRGKRVLLTGHTGFKGAWLSLWLERLGADVTGLAIEPPSETNLFEVANVAAGIKDVRCDLRDFEAVNKVVTDADPEVIIHMAAQSLVRPSYDDPVGTYAANVMGTVHLMEAARNLDTLESMVIVTSDKSYENREWDQAYVEDDAMGGYDPYSSSKGCAELVTSAYRRSFFNPDRYDEHGVAVASVRAGNVIGGGDWAHDRLVPDIVQAFLEERDVVIRYPDAIRPWQHTLDPLAGYLRLAQLLASEGADYAEGWNFGPDSANERPVKDLVDIAAKQWGEGAGWQLANDIAPHEAQYLKLDSTKARTRLDWRPQLPLEDALKMTMDWYRAHASGEDMRAFTMAQIDAYRAKL